MLTALVLFLASPLQASDVDDLKAAFEASIEEVRKKNIDGFLSHWHPEAVFFARHKLFAVDRTETPANDWHRLVDEFFAKTISADFVPVDFNYRVVGNTGMVWGLGRFTVDARYGAGTNFDSRTSVTFSKIDGEWKIVHWHSSATPIGEKGPLQ